MEGNLSSIAKSLRTISELVSQSTDKNSAKPSFAHSGTWTRILPLINP